MVGVDRVGVFRRARRVADVSQREMAERVGVSAATIARAELVDAAASLELLERVLSVAGLRLAVLDADDHEVQPMRADAVRDNAGRRFPAHLDVHPAPAEVSFVGGTFRYDRPSRVVSFRRRGLRDLYQQVGARRRAAGKGPGPFSEPDEEPRPQDHL
ncbi:MAG: hypothetical protein CSA58_08400, partial [Micrococcales bacterium]